MKPLSEEETRFSVRHMGEREDVLRDDRLVVQWAPERVARLGSAEHWAREVEHAETEAQLDEARAARSRAYLEAVRKVHAVALKRGRDDEAR